MNTTAATLKSVLQSFKPDPNSSLPERAQKAIHIARHLQQRVNELQTPAERRQQAELDRMLQNPEDKATLAQMTDQAFRAKDPRRAVDQFIHILDAQGIPRFFSPLNRTLLRGFHSFGGYLPGVALPWVKAYMRKETANVILPGEREALTRHLRERFKEGVRMNVNFLGEAILGEGEAERRLQIYLQALQWPEIEVVSIKISTLFSQISALAREHTLQVLCDRLDRLFRTAARQTFTRRDGAKAPKFVCLDMEEYRDMALTAEAFMRTLDRPGLENVSAGIALQSYIPDSYRTQLRINEWARRRAARGGAPIAIRLVKGANMEMERVEASLRGWPQAPYKVKRHTDANFKRMLHEAMKPENLTAVRVGIASHNLFDLAYGIVLALEQDALDKVQFEMLEGMANPQRRAMFELTKNLLLYAPACRKENFVNAIGYLIRRLDENTGPENFLRHAFSLKVGSPVWQRLEQGFAASVKEADAVSDAPRRVQNRNEPPTPVGAIDRGWRRFVNEPDTDFSLPHNSDWARKIVEKWEPLHDARAPEIPLQIAGEELLDQRSVRPCLDPSRPGVVVGRYREAAASDIDRAAACAAEDPDGWRRMSVKERFDALGRAAQRVREKRADLIGAAMADGGKIISESDPEVSEAVDYLEFYRDTAREWFEMPTLKARPKGVVVVVSPWNFPLAIPAGGIAAALAAGNTVIFKPASDAVLPAYELCRCFWEAGVPKRALQFAPCRGQDAGRRLVAHPAVKAVILTGGTETALAILKEKPDLNLAAETGGKNATIVTALSDRDQAIRHVIHSAFSHSGQKCSATSLLLLEREVYEDRQFREALCDAARSLTVGSAWNLHTKLGPLIRPPTGKLEEALKALEPGEEWALIPEPSEDNPNLWSPGIKYGVRPGSVTHKTEFFGPVLGVMPFDRLSEAIDLVNSTGYGLTSGIESLDDREIDFWKERIRAGNLYVNRPTTGAIVLRQPFGGMGKSAFGMGIKAGGPNYVAQLMDFEDAAPPPAAPQAPEDPLLADLYRQIEQRVNHPPADDDAPVEVWRALLGVITGYERRFKEEFDRLHDHFLLLGEDNFRLYRPLSDVRIRVHPEDSAFELFARVIAARTAGGRAIVSVPPKRKVPGLKTLEAMTESWGASIEFVQESDQRLAEAMHERLVDRVRYAARSRVPRVIWEASAATGIYVAAHPVLREGRWELLAYLQEQSLSHDYHRYGNLGARAGEQRSEPS